MGRMTTKKTTGRRTAGGRGGLLTENAYRRAELRHFEREQREAADELLREARTARTEVGESAEVWSVASLVGEPLEVATDYLAEADWWAAEYAAAEAIWSGQVAEDGERVLAEFDARDAAAARAAHSVMVADYRAARAAAELEREAATLGYATEGAEHGPLITFKDWLTMTAGRRAGGYAPGA